MAERPRVEQAEHRRQMVEEQLVARGISDQKVLKAMAEVPRELFIDSSCRGAAYDDSPLPLQCGQTISQPYIVALMSQELRLQGSEKVLEVGTGSGYQTAILARLAGEVYSLERQEMLYRQARRTLNGPRYPHVFLRHGDGRLGWPEKGPFRGILVAAAAESVPPALMQQLDQGGRMVIPLRQEDGQEVLTLISCGPEGFQERVLLPVRFVPLLPGRV